MLLLRGLGTFLFVVLAGGVFVAQHDRSTTSVTNLFVSEHVAPLIVLSGAPMVYLVLLIAVAMDMRARPAAAHLFPPLLGADHPSASLQRRWDLISAVIVLVVPLLLLGWFWTEIGDRREAWASEGGRAAMYDDLHACRALKVDPEVVFPDLPGAPVSIWRRVHPCLAFGGWNAYRYGNRSAEDWGDADASASFLPFWQPLVLMLLPFVACAGLAGWLGLRVEARRRRSRPSV